MLVYATQPTCPSTPYQAYVWDSLTPKSSDNKYCGVTTPEPSKNLGDDCRNTRCGQNKGNPVNLGTGNKFQREPDFEIGDLKFVRYYNSRAGGLRTSLGRNWVHNWARSLVFHAGSATILRPDGKFITFSNVNGSWVAPADYKYTLTPVTGGYEVLTLDDEIESYDAARRLVSVRNREGRMTTLSYTDGTTGPGGGTAEGTTKPLPPGLLKNVTDVFGRSIQFGYNINGRIVRVTDPNGAIYLYGHDTQWNLTSVQGPDLTTRTYVYNESANTSGAYLPTHLTGIIDENGNRFATYQYFTDGRAKSTSHAGDADSHTISYGSGTRTYTDPLGSSRTANVSTFLSVEQVTSTTQTCVGCGGTTTETFTFDANRNIASRKDFNGNLTCYTHDSIRNLETVRVEGLSGAGSCASQVTTPATRMVTTEWHSTHRLVRRIAEPLRITTHAFHGDPGVSCAPSGASTALVCSTSVQATTDADGSLAFTATADGPPRVTTYSYNALGQLLTTDGPRASPVLDVTTRSYYTSNDPAGKYRAGDLASVTNAAGHVTQYLEYDAAGRPLKIAAAGGLESHLEYWPRGWLKTRKVGSAAAGFEITSYEYHNVGTLKKVTLPDGSHVSYTYDAAQRLSDVQDGQGNRIHYTLDGAGNRTAEDTYDPSNVLARTQSRVIDMLNRVKQEIGGTSPSTQVTQYGRDGNGNITTITDALSRVTVQEFDALDRLKAVKDPFNGTSNPTTYAYNRQGVLTQVTDPTGLSTTYTVNGHGEVLVQASPDTGNTTFSYDPAGNMETKLDARNVLATYTHDALGRVTQVSYPDETVTYVYDSCTQGVGRLCSLTDKTGTTTWTYDFWGRVATRSQAVSGLTQTIAYTYNAVGQLASITYPSGRIVTYGYANNRPVSVSVDGTPILDSAVYEPFGPVGGWRWGNSTTSTPNTHTRVHDLDYRVTRVTSDLPVTVTQPYFDRQFTWDAMSRIGSIQDLANSALDAVYGYDSLDRLTSATQGVSSWGYAYDGIGNRLTSTVGAVSTTYGYFANTHRLQSLSGAQSKSYSFDAAGNMTSDGTTTWVYGGNGRPTSAGGTAFAINALGQRVMKGTGTSAIRFVYDDWRLLGEYDAAGSVIQETVWLGDLPVATLRPNGTGGAAIYYVHADQLGTPRAVTRPSDNQVVWKWDNTEVFGDSAPDENPSGLGSFAFNLRFPGQYYDAETGKHYNYFRDYDPEVGRYLRSDSVGLAGGLNTFGYVRGSPLALADPLGLTPSDVNGVMRDVQRGNPDVRPSGPGIGYSPQRSPNGGHTDWKGKIFIDPNWSRISCFTPSEYRDLYLLLLHEGMHSTDNVFKRPFTDHQSIYNREAYAAGEFRDPPQPTWGNPGQGPINFDRLYQDYRKRTPACCDTQ